MKPSEMRAQLIAEHDALRALAAEVGAEAERVAGGAGDSIERLRDVLERFDEALEAHNLHEEHLLRDEIRSVDAWGPEREALMDASHEAEHASILGSLKECAAREDAHEVARHAREVVQRVLDHIKGEEKDLLHPDILRDDVVTIQAFGG
jgi:hypothetical protein